MNHFAKNVRYLRKKFNMGQDELADKLGYKSYTTIQKWESSDSEPTLSTLHKIADIFNISINSLVDVNLENEGNKEYLDNSIPSHFSTAKEAMQFMLNQAVVMGFNGLDVTKLSEEEQIQYANDMLDMMKLVSLKYKDKK
ncbi:helix-turn-helix domain-containing protein [Helcococcus bovis]|uniref:helix-turn-helix domain-containing protein n=1 Tax=Helcococcus bovis TaxID=3153252 RepID=UPI0038B97B91